MQLLIYACWIIAWPISKILDHVLGDQHSVSVGIASILHPGMLHHVILDPPSACHVAVSERESACSDNMACAARVNHECLLHVQHARIALSDRLGSETGFCEQWQPLCT